MHIVDLFCGCGGFSLGAQRAGFRVPVAFDVDSELTSSRGFNFPGSDLVIADVRELSGDLLREMAGAGTFAGVIGGPPCQGFSTIGKRESTDPRRELVYQFFRLVAESLPLFFVMENVTGLALDGSRHLLDESLELVSGRYSICGPMVLDASDYGAPTRRRRLFVVGTLKDHVDPFHPEDLAAAQLPPVNVAAAIADLGKARYIGDDDGFDVWRLDGRAKVSAYASQMRAPNAQFTGNRRTAHNPTVVNRFSSVRPGEADPVGKHYRLSWDGLCPTLRAGTGSDKGSFQSVRPLHPDEPRVITVREAARLQGFPDSFRFHRTIWHSFRMIGNSVSPLQSAAIFSLLRAKFDASG